ncbi:uncharacterized protein LOC134273543 [Saccostrea cucullata]|uniref:uncharacterized protein LOC134273543 n=1 Tax=Saccostrea cuccullata TaxID=36930 RepID=UPI002ED3AE82
MARRINPGITLKTDRYALAELDVNYYDPRWDYTREEIERYFISPRRELASRFAWEMGEYDEEKSDEDQPSTSYAHSPVPPVEPEPEPEPKTEPVGRPQTLYTWYLSLRYIGVEETFTDRFEEDFIDSAAINSLATDMLSRDLIKAFYDAASVPQKRKKPNIFRRVLRRIGRCFGRCFGCCCRPQTD